MHYSFYKLTCFPASLHVIVGGGLAPMVWQRTSTNFPAETGSFLLRIVTDVGPTVNKMEFMNVEITRPE